jgi:hypothetical protein
MYKTSNAATNPDANTAALVPMVNRYTESAMMPAGIIRQIIAINKRKKIVMFD